MNLEQKVNEHDLEIKLMKQKAESYDEEVEKLEASWNKNFEKLEVVIEKNYDKLRQSIHDLRDNVASNETVLYLMKKQEKIEISVDENSKRILETENFIQNFNSKKEYWKNNWYQVVGTAVVLIGLFYGLAKWTIVQDHEAEKADKINAQQSQALQLLMDNQKQINLKIEQVLERNKS